MTDKKLIENISNDDYEIITESNGDKKDYIIKGDWMVSEKKNLNGRKYQKNEFEKEIERIQPIIESNRMYGELDHGENGTIELHRISHKFILAKMNGNNIFAEAKILDTPNGKAIKVLIDEGFKPGVSSKGRGKLVNVKNNNESYNLVTNFSIESIGDIVYNPSAQVFPEVFLEMIMENDKRMEEIFKLKLIEDIQKDVRNTSNLSEERIKAFNKLINELNK